MYDPQRRRRFLELHEPVTEVPPSPGPAMADLARQPVEPAGSRHRASSRGVLPWAGRSASAHARDTRRRDLALALQLRSGRRRACCSSTTRQRRAGAVFTRASETTGLPLAHFARRPPQRMGGGDADADRQLGRAARSRSGPARSSAPPEARWPCRSATAIARRRARVLCRQAGRLRRTHHRIAELAAMPSSPIGLSAAPPAVPADFFARCWRLTPTRHGRTGSRSLDPGRGAHRCARQRVQYGTSGADPAIPSATPSNFSIFLRLTRARQARAIWPWPCSA